MTDVSSLSHLSHHGAARYDHSTDREDPNHAPV